MTPNLCTGSVHGQYVYKLHNQHKLFRWYFSLRLSIDGSGSLAAEEYVLALIHLSTTIFTFGNNQLKVIVLVDLLKLPKFNKWTKQK